MATNTPNSSRSSNKPAFPSGALASQNSEPTDFLYEPVKVMDEKPLSSHRTVILSASTISSTVEIDLGGNVEFIIRNRSSSTVYVAMGSSTVTSTSGIQLGQDQTVSTYSKAGFTTFAAITSSGSADVEITVFAR